MAMNIYNRSGQLVGQSAMIDASPTADSENVVESGGVYSAVESAPDKSVIKESKNLIVKASAVNGTINTSTGEITPSNDYYVTEFIPVDLSRVYIAYGCDKFGAYQSDKTFISVVTINTTPYDTQSLQIPANTAFVRIRIPTANIDDAICADVRYYTPGVTSGAVNAGFTEGMVESVKIGISQFADANPDLMVNSGNLFDWRNDFAQVASSNALRNDGAFFYMNNPITTDADFTSTTHINPDKYFPISYGEMIVCNYYLTNLCFYNSQKTFISNKQNRNGYQAVEAPANSAYVRISIKGSSDQAAGADIIKSLAEIQNIIVFKVEKIGENDLIPKHEYLKEAKQIDGGFISPNYLDKVEPSMTDSDFLAAMKCTAIRTINERDGLLRFGNFNMWIMENAKGWNNVRRMLMDLGIDFCGFEECVINESTAYYKGIAEFLHSWQFPYGFYSNWTDEEDQLDKSFVSKYPLASATKMKFTTTSSNASYLNCRVNLPRYNDHYNPYRVLSVYIVHFPITDQATKITVANELLGVVANDTSDFVIIFGDTNDFATKDYWNTLETGGFTPVIPTTTKTVTQDNISESGTAQEICTKYCIDQFLVSSNISMVNYGVINTKDKYYIEDGYESSATDNEPALSDHDFVWVDLKFDYDTPRNNLPS